VLRKIVMFVLILFIGLLSKSPVIAAIFVIRGDGPGGSILCHNRIRIALSESPDESEESDVLVEGECPLSPMTFTAADGDFVLVNAWTDGYVLLNKGKALPHGLQALSRLTLTDVETGRQDILFAGLSERPAGFYSEFLSLRYRIGTPTSLWTLSRYPEGVSPPFVNDSLETVDVESEGYRMVLHPDADSVPGKIDLSLSLPAKAKMKFTIANYLDAGGSDPLYLIGSRTIPVNPEPWKASGETSIEAPSSVCFSVDFENSPKPVAEFHGNENEVRVSLRTSSPVPAYVAGDGHFLNSGGKWGETPFAHSMGSFSVDLALPEPSSLLRALAEGTHHLALVFPDDLMQSAGYEFTVDALDAGDGNETRENDDSLYDLLSAYDLISSEARTDTGRFLERFVTAGDPVGRIDLPINVDEVERVRDRWCDVFEFASRPWASADVRGFLLLAYQDSNLLDVTAGVALRCFEDQEVTVTTTDEDGNTTETTDIETVEIEVPKAEAWVSFDLGGREVIVNARNQTGTQPGVILFGNEFLPVFDQDIIADLKASVAVSWNRSPFHGSFESNVGPLTVGPATCEIHGKDSSTGVRKERVTSSTGRQTWALDFELKVTGSYVPNDLRAFVVFDRHGDDAYGPTGTGDLTLELTRQGRLFTGRAVLEEMIEPDNGTEDSTEDSTESGFPQIMSFWYVALDKDGLRYPGEVMGKRFVLSLLSIDAPFLTQISWPELIAPGTGASGEVSVSVATENAGSEYGLNLGLFKEDRGTVWLDGTLKGKPWLAYRSSDHFAVNRFHGDLVLPLHVDVPDDFWSFMYKGEYSWIAQVVDRRSGQVVSFDVMLFSVR
jgi:hypothetical protein